jgi:hypothetical protein
VSKESSQNSEDKKEEVKERKEIAPRSEVWFPFIKIIVDHLKRVKCKYSLVP